MSNDRITIALPHDKMERIKQMAQERGISAIGMIRILIQRSLYIEDHLDQGGSLVFKELDGTKHILSSIGKDYLDGDDY